ncbi:phage terminase small subunit P27 family [Yeosuana sp.]|uniref:phage terminase small subunit P27 family n=1 Tax=Yeosuana sp. TaxID=2529388 RepID=UPI00405524F4
MGRARKPTTLKKKQGTLQKCRTLENELTPALIHFIDTPDFLQEDQKKMFQFFVDKFSREGLMTTMDDVAVTALAIDYSIYIDSIKKVNAMGLVSKGKNDMPLINPYLKIANNALKNVMKICVEFGMTPAARTKVAAAPKKEITLKDMLSDGFGS